MHRRSYRVLKKGGTLVYLIADPIEDFSAEYDVSLKMAKIHDRIETLVANVRSHSSEEGGTDLAWGFRVKTAKGKQRLAQDLSLEKGFLP